MGRVKISKDQLTKWAGHCLRMNHHGTLVQREIAAGHLKRAAGLAERETPRVDRSERNV